MRIYPDVPSGIAGQGFTLCVEPASRFKLAFFRQDWSTELVPVPFPRVTATRNVTALGQSNGVPYFRSDASSMPETPDKDWQWPSIAINTSHSAWGRDVYIAAIYGVDSSGQPVDDIGRAFQAGQGIVPLPPYSDSMALFVLKPALPAEANIAYIIPVATYHAYNYTGNGCFYGGCPSVKTFNPVTLRRPGGGLGGIIREPVDPYDTFSPRQHFAHWDAKLISWIKNQGFSIDFYTDVDLDRANPLVLPDGRPWYSLLVSAGHHEYWTPNMRANVQKFLNAGLTDGSGGNYAIFSGNTCWWESAFSANWTLIGRKSQWPGNNESDLIGLTWEYGSGWWGTCNHGTWTKTERQNIGYTLHDARAAQSWVFAGTNLQSGQTFGDYYYDYLVGYECDGLPATPNPHFQILAKSAPLTQSNGWDKNGQAAMVLRDSSTGRYKAGTVFNCGTTDWARVLTDTRAAAHNVVNQMTQNVVRTLSEGPDFAERLAGKHASSTL
jgi:hypothetical protein